jgi:hypothetical protein
MRTDDGRIDHLQSGLRSCRRSGAIVFPAIQWRQQTAGE